MAISNDRIEFKVELSQYELVLMLGAINRSTARMWPHTSPYSKYNEEEKAQFRKEIKALQNVYSTFMVEYKCRILHARDSQT